VIVFLVGTEVPRRFTIHEGLIRTRSDFVQLALRGEWKEARERTIPLPEDDPDVFSVYQQFLYGGLIYTSYKNAPSRPDDEYKVLVKAYILGEKIMDQEFKDSIVDAIIEKLRTLRSLTTLRLHRHCAAFGWMRTITLAAPSGSIPAWQVAPSTLSSWPSSVATRCSLALGLARLVPMRCF
jgi:hypothetical protein